MLGTNRPAVRLMLALLMACSVAGAQAARPRDNNGANVGVARAAPAPAPKGKGATIAPPPIGDANIRVEKQITLIKAAGDAGARAEAAGGLVDALVGVNMTTITPLTINDIAGLLADKENVVRYWAALALAQIGPPAKAAAPALETALKDAEKLPADDKQSPVGGICLAFLRTGLTPQDGRCVNGQYLDAKQKATYDASQASKAAAPAAAPAQPAAKPTVSPAPPVP